MTDADRVIQAVDRLKRWIVGSACMLFALFTATATAIGFIWWIVNQQAADQRAMGAQILSEQRIMRTQILNLKAREQGIYQRIEQLEREHNDERPDEAKSDRPDP